MCKPNQPNLDHTMGAEESIQGRGKDNNNITWKKVFFSPNKALTNLIK